MEVVGKIKVINPIVEVSTSFKKRELVVVTNEQYPQMILIEFAQDKCDLLNNYKVGQNVTVSINLRGREWINPEGVAKYFNQIQGWKIETAAGDVAMPSEPILNKENEPDDLPF